jgi:MoaA/NifB/PqqE/SkfB family radical SAM enzyme
MRAFKGRLKRGELFPPFLFLALTNACNLRCKGCWIESHGKPDQLELDDVESVIESCKKQGTYYHTLLGGEPFIYPHMWEVIERHPECYFQIITNGMFLTDENCDRIKRLGNITPLISIDGLAENNDARRGEGTFDEAIAGCRRLQERKIIYGVATVVTGSNLDEVMTDEYVRHFIDLGAMYLWYYVFRPVGANPSPELCVDEERMIELRTRLIKLRRRQPIILIDTYWNAKGEAVCPASRGLGFHIGPKGSIEPCPPLSLARESIRDNDGDLFQTINESEYLRSFQDFVNDRTKGCVILEHPQALADFFREQEAEDMSGRDILAEFDASTPKTSHHLPGREIPENYWVYKILKKMLFFGMGAYG